MSDVDATPQEQGLATHLSHYTELVREIDWAKAPPRFDPSRVPHRSSQVLDWVCPVSPEHRWQAPVANRTRQPGCPYCLGKKVARSDSLGARFPRVVAMWSPRNGTLTPFDVLPKSDRPILVRPAGASADVRTTPASLTQRGKLGHVMPRTTIKEHRPLFRQFVALEEDPDRPASSILSSSNKRATWRCLADPAHIFVRPVYAVKAGLEAMQKRCKGKRSDKLLNFCPRCHGTEVDETNCLRRKNPHVADEFDAMRDWNGLTSESVFYASTKRYWFRCHCGHEWNATLGARTTGNKTGCPRCAGSIVTPETSLRATHPDLAEEWDYESNRSLNLTPELVSSGSEKKVWWTCKHEPSHRWRAAVNARAARGERMGTGCPKCSIGAQASREARELFREVRKSFPDLVCEHDDVKHPALMVAGWPGRFDAAVPSCNVFIDYDSFRFHVGEKRRDADARKTRVARSAGYVVIRIRQGEIGRIHGARNVMVEKRYCLKTYARKLTAAIRKATRRSST